MSPSSPVRATFLPFSRPTIGEEEKAAVAAVLDSGWLASGPRVREFEEAFGKSVGAPHAIALTSATEGLEVALRAIGVGPGDEVIVPAMTFVATANVVVHVGAKPLFADVDPRTFNLLPSEIDRLATPKTKAVMPVHFTGHPCDLDDICARAAKRGIRVVEDAAHAVGAAYKGVPIGARPDTVAVFSFHPNKNMTTGEGGMITTHDEEVAERSTVWRFHGLNKDAWKRFASDGKAHTDALEPGYKANMTDLAATIGLVQLRRLPGFNERRRALADRYDRILSGIRGLLLPARVPFDHLHPRHLYTPLVVPEEAGITRDQLIAALKEENIGTGLHYTAAHLHSYYRREWGTGPGFAPNAERIGETILSLPLFPTMTEADQDDVEKALRKLLPSA
jgi:UDP-4-amino-4-deoxy-L-arabinose-oxoglutarate aminotransferase